ncbi:DUF317 domain-containing protein [Streptomyces sp. NPDC059070]|uniref:DUF317 domain-containing protein n=1 Tax=Streptomyces sp. NPDC059070 TaxID=3346713 RepID=UPI003689D7D9
MTVDVPNGGFRTTVQDLRLRQWLLGPGQPTEVLDVFPEAGGGFHVVTDDRADVHIASADGRFYLGWFPDGRPGAAREGWVLAVTGTARTPGYRIVFEPGTPARLVAATVSEVLATAPTR